MIKQLFDMPHDRRFILACSGGVDSMAVADFYLRGRKDFIVAYFDHGTKLSPTMGKHVKDWADRNDVAFVTGGIKSERHKGVSPEEHWRDERYGWLHGLFGFNGVPIVTCHHLDDVVETWLFSCLNGNPKIIQPVNGRVVRPFLTTPKKSLIEWCLDHDVDWVQDHSNGDVRHPRNRIRQNIVPEALLVNPGLRKVVRKKVETAWRDTPQFASKRKRCRLPL